MIYIHELFNQAFCLVLDKRYEQGLEVKKEFKKRLNIDTTLFIAGDGSRTDIVYDFIDVDVVPVRTNTSINYPTWYNRPNSLNAHLCHKEILKRCIDQNLEYMFFFEDDSLIMEDFDDVFNSIAPILNETQWDILHLSGHTKGCPKIQIAPNLYRVAQTGGNYNLIVKKHMLPILYNLPIDGPMDWLVGTRIQPYYQCLMILPNTIIQRSGFSYIEGCHLTKPDRMDI